MTRSVVQIDQALALRTLGLSATEISRDLHLPRSTVRDWLYGDLPGALIDATANCQTCGNPDHDFDSLPSSYVYLLGLYLGDGCISHTHRGVYKLRLSLDSAYPGIIDEAARVVREVMPRNKVGMLPRPSNDVEVYSHSKSWPCLLPQHGPGKKHHRLIKLADWQQRLVLQIPELLIRGLIHSDGCRFMNTGSGGWRNPRYSFTNLSADIRQIFIYACDQMELHWTEADNRTVYVSRKADVARMDTFIGPKA